ncbi:hypothetical protein ncot_12345 [Nocardioides sp. JQ2195]|uniref:hypothetical protein n=1 Tax=Nocardioides sp. JQ2195 TaxID=2592334 RepID=UPI00143E45C5|nr:hypothetical protein [Nocardioides sp. JQ2195]QIX27303.1 hypothetical protein ncot_12345 [Nocardioides sp. JQ2195]
MNVKKTFSVTAAGLAGVVAGGLIAMQAPAVSMGSDQRDDKGGDKGGDQVVAKRDDDMPDLVLVSDDDDDDDTNDRDTRSQVSRQSRNTGLSRATNDNTRSNFTRMSRDRDHSRSDKTRDWTRDGVKQGQASDRDWSANRTNDRSRHDSRR